MIEIEQWQIGPRGELQRPAYLIIAENLRDRRGELRIRIWRDFDRSHQLGDGQGERIDIERSSRGDLRQGLVLSGKLVSVLGDALGLDVEVDVEIGPGHSGDTPAL